jgi:hypothetical protein
VFSGEATNTNIIVFGLTRQGLEPTIYRIPLRQAKKDKRTNNDLQIAEKLLNWR